MCMCVCVRECGRLEASHCRLVLWKSFTCHLPLLFAGSVTERHTVPFYAEKCTAMFGVTYSSSRSHQNHPSRYITTTDVSWSRGGCATGDKGLTGTSASAPMAAGMIALMLDARCVCVCRPIECHCWTV